MAAIGFIGLGAMGRHMAASLLRAGHRPVVVQGDVAPDREESALHVPFALIEVPDEHSGVPVSWGA